MEVSRASPHSISPGTTSLVGCNFPCKGNSLFAFSKLTPIHFVLGFIYAFIPQSSFFSPVLNCFTCPLALTAFAKYQSHC